MTVILTSAGSAHLGELAAGGSLDNAFDGLVFGAGNDAPTIADTLEEVTAREGLPFLRLAAGYPKKNDTDSRNGGAGVDIWTWRFEREAGTPFVASNVAVTNYAGGIPTTTEPLLIHAWQTIAQRYDERLVVFLNVSSSSSPNVVTATETALQNRVQRVSSFTARVRSLQGAPGGSSVTSDTVRSRPQRGQGVWTAAWIWGPDSRTLDPWHVERFELLVEAFNPSSSTWEATDRKFLECGEHVFPSLQMSDPRYHADGGYNVSHFWLPPRGSKETTWRLTYTLRLCDGDVRWFRNEVEVQV